MPNTQNSQSNRGGHQLTQEERTRGGQHSHSGGNVGSQSPGRSSSQGKASKAEAGRKGGENSHGGGRNS